MERVFKSLFFLVVVYVIGVSFFTCFQPLRTDDSFWHLKLGEVISKQGGFPLEDPFLYTSSKMSPLYHEWLFQVLIYHVSQLGGLYSLRFFHLLLVLWIIYEVSLLSGFYFRNNVFIQWVIVTFFLIFSYQRLIQLRPHLVTIGLFFMILRLIFQNRNRFSVLDTIICIISFCIAANMHSLSLMILGFWLLFILLESISKLLFNLDGFNWQSHVFCFTGAFLVMLLNPLGINFFIFYFIGDSRNPYHHVIDEWGHFIPWGLCDFLPLSSPVLVFCFAFLFLCVLSIFVKDLFHFKKRRIEPEKITLGILALISLGLMAYAVRLFWLVPVPLIYFFLFLENRISVFMKRFLTILLILGALVHFAHPGTVIYRFPFDHPVTRKRYFTWTVDRIKYHSEAVLFLKQKNISGNIFNPYFMGGYLSFMLHPRVKVFIDGRFEHYSHKVNRDYYLLKTGQEPFLALVAKYRINIFFVPNDPDWEGLSKRLEEFGFIKLFQNFSASVYLTPDKLI